MNSRGYLGRSALHLSTKRSTGEILLKAYVAASSQDDYGSTPLHLSSSSLNASRLTGEIFKMLPRASADANNLDWLELVSYPSCDTPVL